MATIDVEVFAPGHWAGRDWTIAQIDQMVQNFPLLHPLGIRPPVKLGHTDRQILAQKDGQPALGWISGLTRVGTKLVATLGHVPDLLADLIRKKRYARVSSELYPMFELTDIEKNLMSGAKGCVLSGLALLGADVPEVKTLADLHRVLACEADGVIAQDEASVFAEADVTVGEIVPTITLNLPPGVDQETFLKHVTQIDWSLTSLPVPPKEQPMTDAEKAAQDEATKKMDERMAALEAKSAKFDEQETQLTELKATVAKQAKELEDSKLRETATAAAMRAKMAESWVAEQSAGAKAHIFPTQRKLASALVEKLSELTEPAISAEDAKVRFGEERSFTPLELFQAFIAAMPDQKFHPGVVTKDFSQKPTAFDNAADAMRFVMERDKVDAKTAAVTVRKEFPEVVTQYQGFTASA
jgi:uncharacterized coiled-coil protein SlyX